MRKWENALGSALSVHSVLFSIHSKKHYIPSYCIDVQLYYYEYIPLQYRWQHIHGCGPTIYICLRWCKYFSYFSTYIGPYVGTFGTHFSLCRPTCTPPFRWCTYPFFVIYWLTFFFSTFTCLIRCFVAVQLASFFFVPLYHLYQRQLWKQSVATFIEKKNFWFVSGVATLVQLHRIRQFQFNAITFACFLALEKNISIGNSVCACRQTFGMLFITKWTSFGNFVLLYVEKCNFLLQNIGVGTVESGFKISVEFLLCLNEQRTT